MTIWSKIFSRIPGVVYLLTITAFAQPAGQTTPASQVVTHSLRQILIADSPETAQALQPVPGAGLVVIASTNLSFLDTPELKRRLATGEGQPIDDRLLAGIALVIESFSRQTDFAAATAVIPPQNIAGGIVRVAVMPGKIRDIKVQGARWFSEDLLREKLRLEHGDPLRISELDRAITWTNSNPYRHVRVHIEPVAGTGEADVLVNIEERRPLRLFASYDNTGNDLLGKNRYAAGVNLGNAFGRDHQATYQFITGDDVAVFRAHAADYRVPLPWRHVFGVSASYVQVNPTFFDVFTQKGKSLTTDLKYIVPVVKQSWRGEWTAGVSLKKTNNNLEFGGMDQEVGGTIDVLTGSIGFVATRPDKRGSWLGSATVVGSPGEFNSRSSIDAYGGSRLGANPRFIYTQWSLQRDTALTPTVTSSARAQVQFASTNLVPTEQLSLGGLSTVRGYEERILSGDGGYSFTHELEQRWRAISLGKRLPKLNTSGVFFWDYGRILIKHPEPGQRVSDYLASAGIGLRTSVGQYFSASVDYARQLEKVETPGAAHDRVHVRVSLSY